MPKSYSEPERDYIRARLREEAAKCLASYGVRRTTVDELVKRVHIPKGTFYLFYRSKELLLFEVILEQHERVTRELYQALSGISAEGFSVEALTDLIFTFYQRTEEMLILKRLDVSEVELLVRKLPREVVENHLQDDTDTIEAMLALLPVKGGTDVRAISAAFHAIYFATLHREEIGASYEEGLRALIRGVVMQLV